MSLKSILKEQHGVLREGQIEHYTYVLLASQVRDLMILLDGVAQDGNIKLSHKWVDLIHLLFKNVEPERGIAKYIIFIIFYIKALLTNTPTDTVFVRKVEDFFVQNPKYLKIQIKDALSQEDVCAVSQNC